MKQLFYITGLFFISFMWSGCEEETPSYSDLVMDTQNLVVDMDQSTEAMVRIIQGNGNYKLTNENEDVATAHMEGDVICIEALQPGKTTLNIIDWAKKSGALYVTVKKLVDLVLNTSSMKMVAGTTASTTVYTGNGGYQASVEDSRIAEVTVTEDGEITVIAKEPGETVVTITDEKNKKVELPVKVIKTLVVDKMEAIQVLYTNEPVEISILDGNGGYAVESSISTTYMDRVLEGTKVILTGKKAYKANKTVTIKDAEGQAVDITIMFIDEPYLERTPSLPTYFIKEAFASTYTIKNGNVTYAADFNLAQLTAQNEKGTSGYAIRFTGDLNVGSKTNAQLFSLKSGAADESSSVSVEDCKIDKVENGWYWISFLETGKSVRSYMITTDNME